MPGAYTVRPEGIIRQPALTMPGNATGSEAACTALTGSQIRAICGLGTTDIPTFGGLTLNGHVLMSPTNTYDIGNGTYDPRTVRAATSVLTPLLNNTNAAALIVGNSTYGVTVPGAATFSGDISMSKTSAQGYIRAYYTDGVKNTAVWNDGINGRVSSSAGHVVLDPGSGAAVSLRGIASSPTGAVNQSAVGTLDLLSDAATSTWVAWSELTVANRGALGFAAGSSTLSYRAGGYSMATGIEVFSITSGGAVTTTGDISMSKTSAQGYIRAYYTDGVKNAALYHDGTFARLQASTGSVLVYGPTGVMIGGNAGAISTQGGGAYVFTDTGASSFGTLLSGPVRSYDVVGGTKYSQLTHDGTNGILSTSSGAAIVNTGGVNRVVVGGSGSGNTVTVTPEFAGTVFTFNNNGFHIGTARSYGLSNDSTTYLGNVTYAQDRIMWSTAGGADININKHSYLKLGIYGDNGLIVRNYANSADAPISCAGITASGAIQETYRTSSLDPTTSDIGSGKRQGWYNTTATEFRDWVNVGGTLYKSAAYT